MKMKSLLAGALLFTTATVYADEVIGGVIYCAPQLDYDDPSGKVVVKTECANAPAGPGSQDNGSWQAPFTDWDGATGVAVAWATYGANCGASFGNATYDVGLACDGAATCWYTVDYRVLGDPAPGCAKTFTAQYRCPGSTVAHSVYVAAEAGIDKIATFNCQ